MELRCRVRPSVAMEECCWIMTTPAFVEDSFVEKEDGDYSNPNDDASTCAFGLSEGVSK